MCRFSFAPMLLCCAVMCVAQQPQRFHLRNSTRVSGTEEYTVTKSDAGYAIRGVITLHEGEKNSTAKQETLLKPDWSFSSYTYDTNSEQGPIKVTAALKDHTVSLTATVGAGATKEREFTVGEHALALENFVPSQADAAMHAGVMEFDAIVPSAGTKFHALLSKVGKAEGKLAGKTIGLSKYTLAGGGPLIEIWADEKTNDLMRLAVPSQEVEYVRDGFELIAAPEAKVQPPAGVTERETEFESAGLTFPAVVTLPTKAASKPPVIVLVHGSGAHDRDETIADNKPFRDIAWGLAQQGIATLRYDKRAFLYPTKAGTTLDTQVIADAIAAVAHASRLPDVDGHLVFVLGHSLGGSMAPYIAERTPVRGIVMMAAPARALNEVIKDQLRLGLKSQGKSDAEIEKVIAEQDKVGQDVLAGKATPEELHGQVSPAFFKDLLSRDPAAELKKTNVPLLVLQGGKDAQVFRSDFDILSAIAKDRPKSEAKLFPELNHLFMTTDKPNVYDAFKPGHVAPEVMQTIGEWVKKVARGQ
jgi:uncharacterized protein